MHITSIALLWVMIQTLPLVVMLVIYYFFAEQNFFQIEGLWKGVIASGPIAAYVFLTWIGFRYFKELAATFDPRDNFDDLVGTWNLTSQSAGRSQATGTCEITLANRRLSLSGTFEEGDNPTVVWRSDIAFVDGNWLFYVYRLEATGDNYVGYVRVHLKRARGGQSKIAEMNGDWVAIGAERKRGKISFSRAKAAG